MKRLLYVVLISGCASRSDLIKVQTELYQTRAELQNIYNQLYQERQSSDNYSSRLQRCTYELDQAYKEVQQCEDKSGTICNEDNTFCLESPGER